MTKREQTEKRLSARGHTHAGVSVRCDQCAASCSSRWSYCDEDEDFALFAAFELGAAARQRAGQIVGLLQ